MKMKNKKSKKILWSIKTSKTLQLWPEQDKEISMSVWDDSVTYEDVGKMAQSFKRNMGGE